MDREPTFRDMVDEKDYREYVLGELRLALLRVKLYRNEIISIGCALKSGAISPTSAMEWMHEAGALKFLLPTPPAGNGDARAVDSIRSEKSEPSI